MTQLHDGRWVKMRELTSGEEIAATAAANVQLVNGQVPVDGQMKVAREKVKMALVAVTRPMPKSIQAPVAVAQPDGTPATAEPQLPADTDWQPLTYSGLETSFDELFGAKERAQLAGLYDHIHSMIPMEDAVGFFANIRSVASST